MIALLFVAVACDNSAPSTESGDGPDANPEPAPEPTAPARPKLPPVGVCAYISTDDVTAVTGQTYDGALSAAAFPDLAHCEYRQNRHTVTLLIASSEGAVQRMEEAKAGPGKAVEGFEGDAVWDSSQGIFTTMSDGRCVEVSISPNHADPPKHLDHAKALANLVLAKAPAPKE